VEFWFLEKSLPQKLSLINHPPEQFSHIRLKNEQISAVKPKGEWSTRKTQVVKLGKKRKIHQTSAKSRKI